MTETAKKFREEYEREMEEERKNSEIADSLCDILEKQNVSTKNVGQVLEYINNWYKRRIDLENKRRNCTTSLHNIRNLRRK